MTRRSPPAPRPISTSRWQSDELLAALRAAMGEDDEADAGAAEARTPALVLLVDDDGTCSSPSPRRCAGGDSRSPSRPTRSTAVTSAVKQRPDVVVLDIGLPGGDGTVVMQRLHALPQLAGVPVIVLSGRDPAAHREAALAGRRRRLSHQAGRRRRDLAAVVQALTGTSTSS